MKTFNITPRNNKLLKDTLSTKKIELLEFNMSQGDKLNFNDSSKDDLYYKVNIVFNRHCISRIMCIN